MRSLGQLLRCLYLSMCHICPYSTKPTFCAPSLPNPTLADLPNRYYHTLCSVPTFFCTLSSDEACITNILDVSAKPTPLYSPSSPPLCGPNTITNSSNMYCRVSLLAMLFILQLTHTARSCNGQSSDLPPLSATV